ncbi:hypothetical protein DIPPA_15850 [Diplonema papillatum]|nr:hypothetical protein DIPPA_15850 [Diplonema papillatum]
MEGPARLWEPFHITLQNGNPSRLEATNGYRLQITYVTLKSHAAKSAASLLWRPVGARDYRPLARLTALKPAASVGFAFQPPLSDPTQAIELLAKGAAVTLFASWKLYSDVALVSDYLPSESDEDLPDIEDPKRKFTWTMNQAFGNPAEGKKKKRKKNEPAGPDGSEGDVAPPLEAVQQRMSSVPKAEQDGEPAARNAMSTTPPRFLALVSSSPERSASRSEDESIQEYKIRIPSTPAGMRAGRDPSSPRAGRTAAGVCVAAAIAVACGAACGPSGSAALQRESVTLNEPSARKRKAPGSPRHAPAGVLKNQSKRRADGKSFAFTSPRLAPSAAAAAAAALEAKKKVKWNPRSPDVRFISPPLAAIHRAFPGGLLDIGVPLLERSSLASNSGNAPINVSVAFSGLSYGAGSSSLLSLPAASAPRPNSHQPHLPPKITPPAMRPTVIE